MNKGTRIDAMLRRFWPAVQPLDDGHEGVERIRNLDDRQTIGWNRQRHDGGGCPAAMQLWRVFFIFDKGDVAGKRLLERARGGDEQVAITDNLPVD